MLVSEPRYMGGQAVLEGVMMRGATTWAVAVREPDGEIKVDVRDVPGWAEQYRNIPVVRGVMGLGESLGSRLPGAHLVGEPAGARRGPGLREGAGLGGRVAVIVFSALFIVLPALAGRLARRTLPRIVPVVEGIARLALFVVYLLGDRVPGDIRRVFQYHGAEHKSIAAYENDVELTPEIGAAVHAPRTCAAARTSC